MLLQFWHIYTSPKNVVGVFVGTLCNFLECDYSKVALSTKHSQTQTSRVARTLLMACSTHAPCLPILLIRAVLRDIVDDVASRLFAGNSDAFMQVRLNKWLNELEQMFYGMSFAFDKSLTGDEVITGALLRNFYNDDKSKQKPAEILSRYVTRLAINELLLEGGS